MPYDVLDPANAVAAPVVTIGEPLTSVGETVTTADAELDAMLGERADVDATRRLKWLNQSYQFLSSSIDLRDLYNSISMPTVADKNLLLLPASVSWVKRVSLSDEDDFPIEEGRQLQKIDLAKYRQLPVSDAYTDTYLYPRLWFPYRKMLVVYPTPDEVYSLAVDVKVRPDNLVDGTDSPLLPLEWHYPWILKARAIAFRALRMYREAAAAENDFVGTVRPMLNTDAEERESEDAHMSPARSVRMLYRGVDF